MRPIVLAALLGVAPSVLSAQAVELRTRHDLAGSDTATFVRMPPGWHVTTSALSGVTLEYPSLRASGRYLLSLEVFLFPGNSQEGYGLFVGGTGLESNEPAYVSFEIRRDGMARVVETRGARLHEVVPWTSNSAIVPHPGNDDAQLNVIGVSVGTDSIRMDANGKRVLAITRGDLIVEGAFGIRAGRDLNLHVSNLDFTRRLAPAPAPRPGSTP